MNNEQLSHQHIIKIKIYNFVYFMIEFATQL